MKSFLVKFSLATALLAAILVAFCPQVTLARVPPRSGVQRPEPVSPRPGVKHLTRVEDLVLAETNRARQVRGLPPLARDPDLRNAARAFSDDMLVRRFFSHTTPDGVPFYIRLFEYCQRWARPVGENIWDSMGYEQCAPKTLAKLIVGDWMGSTGHRENLLDPEYTHSGVGVSARDRIIKVTMEFVGKF